MFTTIHLYSQATRRLFDAQMACLTDVVHAVMDGNVNATERHVDAMKALMATATVAARQWSTAGNGGIWPAALPDGVRTQVVPDAGMPVRSSLE